MILVYRYIPGADRLWRTRPEPVLPSVLHHSTFAVDKDFTNPVEEGDYVILRGSKPNEHGVPTVWKADKDFLTIGPRREPEATRSKAPSSG
jgi:hypothetical protein